MYLINSNNETYTLDKNICNILLADIDYCKFIPFNFLTKENKIALYDFFPEGFNWCLDVDEEEYSSIKYDNDAKEILLDYPLYIFIIETKEGCYATITTYTINEVDYKKYTEGINGVERPLLKVKM